MNLYIKSDLFRYSGKTTLWSFVNVYLHNSAFRYMVAHRLVNSSGYEKILGGGYGSCVTESCYIFQSRLR